MKPCYAAVPEAGRRRGDARPCARCPAARTTSDSSRRCCRTCRRTPRPGKRRFKQGAALRSRVVRAGSRVRLPGHRAVEPRRLPPSVRPRRLPPSVRPRRLPPSVRPPRLPPPPPARPRRRGAPPPPAASRAPPEPAHGAGARPPADDGGIAAGGDLVHLLLRELGAVAVEE